MGENTTISWTDHTFNPWIGCHKVSEGCKNCYAEKLVKNRMGWDVWGAHRARKRTKTPWANVVKWDRQAAKEGRKRVFCASLADVFEDRPELTVWRSEMWQIVAQCTNLDWQILTKRPENVAAMLPADWGDGYPNVWLGVSVESMETAGRIATLASTPAVVRFVSYEPALGELSENLDLTGIHWLICGGESGAKYREMDIEWARSARVLCEKSGVAYYFKQMSAFRSGQGDRLDGVAHKGMPA